MGLRGGGEECPAESAATPRGRGRGQFHDGVGGHGSFFLVVSHQKERGLYVVRNGVSFVGGSFRPFIIEVLFGVCAVIDPSRLCSIDPHETSCQLARDALLDLRFFSA